MDELIPISNLNDYCFCPYSIYLHNVYIGSDEGEFQAKPQTTGKAAHSSVDLGKSRSDELRGMAVMSEKYGVFGRIDIYKKKEKTLVERKYQLKQIFPGHLYQLWAEYFCMIEEGYEVQKLAFYEISSKRMIYIKIPGEDEIKEFEGLLSSFRNFDLNDKIDVNPNKCRHCIYCNICDKATQDNVY